jgi:hypothetical protein
VDGRDFGHEDGASRLSPSHDDRDQKALTKSFRTAANLQGHGFAAALKLTRMFWIGLGLLALGTGPLLAIIPAASLGLLSDPDPNPIGPGGSSFSVSGRP